MKVLSDTQFFLEGTTLFPAEFFKLSYLMRVICLVGPVSSEDCASCCLPELTLLDLCIFSSGCYRSPMPNLLGAVDEVARPVPPKSLCYLCR